MDIGRRGGRGKALDRLLRLPLAAFEFHASGYPASAPEHQISFFSREAGGQVSYVGPVEDHVSSPINPL